MVSESKSNTVFVEKILDVLDGNPLLRIKAITEGQIGENSVA